MMTRTTHLDPTVPTLFLALELSASTWRLCASDRNGVAFSGLSTTARDLDALMRFIERAKKTLKLPPDARVVTCYEAGRDGFWLHRALARRGIQNLVLDPASIELPRGRRHAKTDRLDVQRLLGLLLRLARGEKAAKIVSVPTPEEEDARHLHRDREKLVEARTAKSNQISSLLFTQGIVVEGRTLTAAQLAELRDVDGAPVPPLLHERLLRAIAARDRIRDDLREVDKQLKARRQKAASSAAAADLARLVGVGALTAETLATEMFWRDFKNRREVGAYTGLVSVPQLSGAGGHNGSISKAGNPRVRTALIELAWRWLRWQPDSPLTAWFKARFAGGARSKRVGIVALARRLAIVCWRYVNDGVVPEAARLKAG